MTMDHFTMHTNICLAWFLLVSSHIFLPQLIYLTSFFECTYSVESSASCRIGLAAVVQLWHLMLDLSEESKIVKVMWCSDSSGVGLLLFWARKAGSFLLQICS